MQNSMSWAGVGTDRHARLHDLGDRFALCAMVDQAVADARPPARRSAQHSHPHCCQQVRHLQKKGFM
jgi:hypothetical protein